MITYYYVCNQLLPILVEKTVKLTGLDWEDQCIFGTQSEIGSFPADEESLYIAYMYARPAVQCPGYMDLGILSPGPWYQLGV